MENWFKLEHIEPFDGSVQKLKPFIEMVDLFHKITKTEATNEKQFLTVIEYCKLSEKIQSEIKNYFSKLGMISNCFYRRDTNQA